MNGSGHERMAHHTKAFWRLQKTQKERTYFISFSLFFCHLSLRASKVGHVSQCWMFYLYHCPQSTFDITCKTFFYIVPGGLLVLALYSTTSIPSLQRPRCVAATFSETISERVSPDMSRSLGLGKATDKVEEENSQYSKVELEWYSPCCSVAYGTFSCDNCKNRRSSWGSTFSA